MVFLNNLLMRLRNQRKAVFILLLVSMIFSLFLSIYTLPYSSDDLIYMNQWNSNQPLSSLADVAKYQINHYLYWGGRTVAHTILQIEFLFGKLGTSILIVLVTFLIGGIIGKLACVNNRVNYLFTLLVVSLLLFLNPNYIETVLWTTGSANYLWTILIILISCYPFVAAMKQEKFKKNHWLCVMMAFFAGWCNENMSTTLVLFMIACSYLHFKKNKKVEPWMLVSICLATIGCALLILAPGNFVRTSTIAGGVMGILYRGHGQVNAWFNWLIPTIVMLVLTTRFVRNKKEIPINSKLFMCWGILSALVMVASPTYPDRATFGTIILFIVPIITNLDILWIENKNTIEIFSLIMIMGFIGTNASIGILQLVRNLGVYIPG